MSKIIISSDPSHQEIIVDDDVYHWAKNKNWRIGDTGYPVFEYSEKSERHVIKLHRLLITCPVGKVTDHINQNKLDNRSDNLRCINSSKNQQNVHPKSASGLKGAYWNKRANKWYSSIKYKTKRIHGGYFNSKEEAALKYNEMATELYGEGCYLNTIESLEDRGI